MIGKIKEQIEKTKDEKKFLFKRKIKYNLKLKLITSYMLIVLVSSTISGIIYFTLKDSVNVVNSLIDVNLTANNMLDTIKNTNSDLKDYITSPTPILKEKINTSIVSINDELTKLEEMCKEGEIQKSYKEINELFITYKSDINYIENSINDNSKFNDVYSRFEKNQTTMTYITDSILGLINKELKYETTIKAKINHRVNTSGLILLAILFVVLLFSTLWAVFFSDYISKPIKQLSKISELIANYDLSIDLDKKLIERNDEIGLIAKSTHNIVNNLKSIINEVRIESNNLAMTSTNLLDSSKNVVEVSNEVLRAVEEIASSASDQAQNTLAGTKQLNELGLIIEKQNIELLKVDEIGKLVGKNIEDGLKIIEEFSGIMSKNKEISYEVKESILNTNESSKKIESASNLIDIISKQTRLLSLNASIEAARAGEAGKGFSVVAEEIRILAQQSSDATKIIASMVEELETNSKSAVQKMKLEEELVQKQVESVKTTKNKYNEINQLSKKTQSNIKDLNEANKQLNEGKVEVTQVIEELSALAEQNAASTEEVTASLNQQGYSINNLKNENAEISNMAKELNELVNKFQL